MSGIAAIFERSLAPAGDARIRRMLDRLCQRGPDRAECRSVGAVALAHAMLETTPEDARDRQPRKSSSREVWIVADARIDNRDELLRLRRERGEHDDAITDSELILWAYERWGEGCAARLVGDFGFAIWDGDRRTLFCARDPLGVRHLYYHHDPSTFRCATEMWSLFADERVRRRPRQESMALFLAYEYSERHETLYEEVLALPPGHTLTVTPAAMRTAPYWQPNPWRFLRGSDADHATHFHRVFSEAVRCRMRAKGPVAAHVSGGLDSSSVACEAGRLRAIGTCTSDLFLMRAVFPGLDCDETVFNQAVVDRVGLEVTTCEPASAPGICPLKVLHPDLYFHPTLTMLDPLLPTVHRRNARVVLTGAGGDLLMQPSGYEAASDLARGRLGSALDFVWGETKPHATQALRRLGGQALWAFTPRVAASVRRPVRHRLPWLSARAAGIVEAHRARERAAKLAVHEDIVVAELCRGITHGVGTLLPMALDDRASGRSGLEQRHPFFDVRVVELLLALPHSERFHPKQGKAVLRRAMGTHLPPIVRDRSGKAEFSSYVRRVFLEEQREALTRLLRASRLEAHGLVRGRVLRELLAAPVPAQNALALANLVAMELWLQDLDRDRVHWPLSRSFEDRHGYN